MAKQTVKLKKYTDIINEYVAGGTVTPGNLVALGSAGTVVNHNLAGKNHNVMLALEDELQGRGLDTNFAVDEPIQCWVPTPGEEGYVGLNASATTAIGTALTSDGAGKLTVANVSAGDGIIAIALEVKAPTHDGFVKCRFE